MYLSELVGVAMYFVSEAIGGYPFFNPGVIDKGLFTSRKSVVIGSFYYMLIGKFMQVYIMDRM